METSILETLGKIAGLGGLALGVFLILFRDILKKLKVPSVTRDQWYKVIVFFMILVWSIAIAGLGTWLYSYTREVGQSQSSNKPPLLWSLEPSKKSPQLLPVTVLWTAKASDPDGDAVYYSFWAQTPPGEGELREVQEWSSNKTFAWTPKKTGVYRITARVRDGKGIGIAEYDDSRSEYFSIEAASDTPHFLGVLAPEQNFQRLMQVAFSFRDAGNWLGALEHYNKALEIIPDDIDALSGKSLMLGNLGRHEETIETCNKLLEIDPENTSAQNNMAMALHFMGRHQEALDIFDNALAIKPSETIFWHNKCVVLSVANPSTEALTTCDKALELNSNDKLTWNIRGTILFSLGRYAEALADHRKAWEIDPSWHMPVFNMGTCYFKLGQHQRALEMFDKALELNPTDVAALNAKRWTEEEIQKGEKP